MSQLPRLRRFCRHICGWCALMLALALLTPALAVLALGIRLLVDVKFGEGLRACLAYATEQNAKAIQPPSATVKDERPNPIPPFEMRYTNPFLAPPGWGPWWNRRN